MKFNEIPYKRPELESIFSELNVLIKKFQEASSAQEQIDLMKSIKEVRNEMESFKTIASIRHSINTNDKFYDSENKLLRA